MSDAQTILKMIEKAESVLETENWVYWEGEQEKAQRFEELRTAIKEIKDGK